MIEDHYIDNLSCHFSEKFNIIKNYYFFDFFEEETLSSDFLFLLGDTILFSSAAADTANSRSSFSEITGAGGTK